MEAKMVAVAVEQGMVIFLLEGNMAKAAKFMAEHNVPVDVARDALLHPSSRSAAEWGCPNARPVL